MGLTRGGLRRAVVIATLVAAAGPATTAQALAPPEILYREGVSETEPKGPWLPLDGARIGGLGFILGTRAQVKPPLDSSVLYRLTALAVPDGHPDQVAAFDPTRICSSNAFAAGTEVPLGLFRYEGPGTYTVRLEVNLPSLGATSRACSGGPASTATFTIDPVVSLRLRRAGPVRLPGNPFSEIAAIAGLPIGSAGETRCARDARVQPDGSVAGVDRTRPLGSSVLNREVPRSGRWTCVGRARATTGADASDGDHYTRWSAPVSFDATSAFSAVRTVPDRRPPRYTIAYGRMPLGSEGGLVTLRITAGKGCPRVAAMTLRRRVGRNRRVAFSFVLPEKDRADLDRGRQGVDSYGWTLRFSFGGTRFVRPANAIAAGFVYPARFVQGHTLGVVDGLRGYCTRTA